MKQAGTELCQAQGKLKLICCGSVGLICLVWLDSFGLVYFRLPSYLRLSLYLRLSSYLKREAVFVQLYETVCKYMTTTWLTFNPIYMVQNAIIQHFDQKLKTTENFYLTTIFKGKHRMSSYIYIFLLLLMITSYKVAVNKCPSGGPKGWCWVSAVGGGWGNFPLTSF